MFLDTAEIKVRSGRGGNGLVSFIHEAYVPKGGPGGGDGGNGGSVCLQVDRSKRTLMDFKYKKSYKADNGKPGGSTHKTGKSGKDLVVAVPPGTMVYDANSGELLADLTRPGDTLLAVRGGKGGRGNARFATPSRQAPRFAEMGEKSEERVLRLELKLIADVGIVGFPNVGKSTLISRISAAKPKIAPYHFTTLEPNLGVVRMDWDQSFVVADVPGLIEGAHQGTGLGHEFLRHVERTRMLIHIVDVAGTEGRDPVEDYQVINHELQMHDLRLASVPQVVGMNKLDVMQEPENLERLLQAVQADERQAFPISAVTGEGVAELVSQVAQLLRELDPTDQLDDSLREPRFFEAPPAPYRRMSVRRMAPETYVVQGTEVEKLVERTNIESLPSLERLQEQLDKMGVMEMLDAKGAQPGDTVFLGDVEMEYSGL